MAATDEQKQAAKTIHDAICWMGDCPVPGSGGDALYETFQTWLDAAMGHYGLLEAYEAEQESATRADGRDDTGGDGEWSFWEAVLARV
jgi:hypothetical protein